MRSRAEIKLDAKRKLNACWVIPAVTIFVVFCIQAITNVILGDSPIAYILEALFATITNVYTTMLFLNIAKNDNFEKVDFSWINVSPEKLLKCIIYSLLMALGTTIIQNIGSWASVLIGALISIFIAVLEVYLSFSLLIILDTDAPILNAAKMSINLIEGNFWNIIIFGLSFVGWFILGGITLGIGFLWVLPYFSISFANYYLTLKYNKQLI